MQLLASLRSFFSVLFRRRKLEGEMEEELRAHVQNRADDLERSGLPRAEAERQARIEFGGYEHFKEECRESVGANFLETFVQDVRFGLRLLRKSPAFTAVAIITLALGIGANTAIFSVVYAVLLRPLPYMQPGQLVAIFEDNLERGIKVAGCDYADMRELRDSGAFVDVAAFSRHSLTLTGWGDPAEVRTAVVTPEMFSVLNVSPLAGRYLLAGDEGKGVAPVVVLSEGTWRTRFGGSLSILGHSILLDQRPFTVVGIMPGGFRIPFVDNQEIWIPVSQDPVFSPFIPQHGMHGFGMVGRLKAGVSLSRAQSEAEAVSRTLAGEFPAENSGWVVHVSPLQKEVVSDFRQPLLILLGAVGLVLLLACVNIANLLLARATARTREMALRQALGAAHGRIVRQLLTESATLGALGAILGVALAYGSMRALVLVLPANLPGLQSVQIDGWVLGFALLLSWAATIAFGLAPALLTTASNMQSNLKDSAARSGSGSGRLRARRFLAAAEIGLAAVLVIAAGLLVRSLMAMTSVDPGFNVARIFKAQVSLPRYQYATPQQWVSFSDALLERVQAQGGLQDSALGVPLPLADEFVKLSFSIPDHAPLAPGVPSSADFVSISPGYFHVMGIPLLRGRLFARTDFALSPPVTIVSESFARFYFKDEDPIGKKLKFAFLSDSRDVTREIVGIVGNVRNEQLTREPGPMMYVPFAQTPLWGANVVVKSTEQPAALAATIRRVVHSIDANLPVTDITTMPEVLDSSVARPKFRTGLIGGFGVVALLLAAVGVFGVVSYSVASRTREFGVRAVLGATPASIGGMILREGLTLGGIGLGLGLSAALGLARFLKTELYGVTVYDPLSFMGSAAILLAVAMVACYIPARRAMKVDPMVALRCE